MSDVDKMLARNAIRGLESAYDQAKMALEQVTAARSNTGNASAQLISARAMERINSAMSEIDMARAAARELLKVLS